MKRLNRLAKELDALIAQQVKKMLNYESTDAEFINAMSGVFPDVSLCGGYPQAQYQLLREVDPTRFAQDKANWEDSTEFAQERGAGYAALAEHMEELTEFLTELEDLTAQLSTLESEIAYAALESEGNEDD